MVEIIYVLSDLTLLRTHPWKQSSVTNRLFDLGSALMVFVLIVCLAM